MVCTEFTLLLEFAASSLNHTMPCAICFYGNPISKFQKSPGLNADCEKEVNCQNVGKE